MSTRATMHDTWIHLQLSILMFEPMPRLNTVVSYLIAYKLAL